MHWGVEGGEYSLVSIYKSIVMVFTPLCPHFGVHQCPESGLKVLDFLTIWQVKHLMCASLRPLGVQERSCGPAYSPEPKGDYGICWKQWPENHCERQLLFLSWNAGMGALGWPRLGSLQQHLVHGSPSYCSWPGHLPFPRVIPKLVSGRVLPLRPRALPSLLFPVFLPGYHHATPNQALLIINAPLISFL